MILSSAGTFTYRGHLHNSGFIGLYCTVGSVVVIDGMESALAAENSFNVGGTISPDDRDQEWSTPSGYSSLIPDHGNELKAKSGLTTSVKAGAGADSFFTLIFFPILAGRPDLCPCLGEPPEGQQCSVSGWHTVKDGNNNTIAEPSGSAAPRPLRGSP